jgi:hypothetical protein
LRKEDRPIKSVTDLLTNLKSYTSDYDGAIWMLLPVELNRNCNIEPDYKNYIPDFDLIMT